LSVLFPDGLDLMLKNFLVFEVRSTIELSFQGRGIIRPLGLTTNLLHVNPKTIMFQTYFTSRKSLKKLKVVSARLFLAGFLGGLGPPRRGRFPSILSIFSSPKSLEERWLT